MIDRVSDARIAKTNPPSRAPGDPSGVGSDARLIELWLFGKSESTKEAYRSDLSKFLDFTAGSP